MRGSLMLFAALLVAGCEPPAANNSATLSAGGETDLNLTGTDANTQTMLGNDVAAAAVDAAPPAGWTYSETKDEMRGSTGRFARLGARDPINLAFPYGQSTPELVLRRDPKYGFDVYLSANGQFLCRSYNNDTVSVKLDDGPIEEWACADAESGSSDIIFIVRAESFLAKLRKAKRLIIEADMYQAGRQQMTFDVAGLIWDARAADGD